MPLDPAIPELALAVNRYLAVWAPQIHAGVLCALIFCWFWPPLEAMFRRLPRSEPEIEWVQLWRCPNCNTYNRRATSICTHCEYRLQAGFFARHLPLKFTEAIKRRSDQLVHLYQFVGWLVFYSLTITVALKLRLYTFQQNTFTELLACAVMLLLLATLMFFRFALRPRLKSPISALMDIIAGTASAGLLLYVIYLWAGAAGQKDIAHLLRGAYASISKWLPL